MVASGMVKIDATVVEEHNGERVTMWVTGARSEEEARAEIDRQREALTSASLPSPRRAHPTAP